MRQPFFGHQDTINVPSGAAVKIRIRYDRPIQLGKFVFHCHILRHEDLGMMRSVEVSRSGRASAQTSAQVAAHSDHPPGAGSSHDHH